MLMRRKWFILLPLSLGLAAAPTLASRIPELYRSETLIMVIPQRIPDDYVKPTVTGSVQDRLATINDVILSRSRLERTIEEFNLYPELRATGLMEDVVKKMRDEDITVGVDGRQSFRVAFVSHDPVLAQKVTSRLATLYIDENKLDREKLAEGTSEFLEAQLEDAKQRLLEHEKKLESYRSQFSGELPSQINSMFQSTQSQQIRLQSNAEAMNRLRERRLLVERQIGDLELAAPDPTRVPPPTAGALAAAEDRLKQLQLKYTANHPDIRAAERAIRDLKARVDEELKAPPVQTSASPEEIARLKRIEELQQDISIIDGQLQERQAEEGRINAAIQSLQQDVAGVPKRESDLVELTRDYGTLQTMYTSLLAKRQESQLAENLERRQIGEQFRILDPASLPQRPFNMRERLIWTASGAIGGLIFGLLLAAALELLDSTFNSEEDVVNACSLPVLAIVPIMTTEQDKRTRRVRKLALDVAGTLVVVASLTIVIVWRLQP